MRALRAAYLRYCLRLSERDARYWRHEREVEAPRREAAAEHDCADLRARLAAIGQLREPRRVR